MLKSIAIAALAAASFVSIAAAQDNDTLRVGMSGGYFPFTFVQQDKLQGFEVDVMNAVAAETGMNVEYVTMSIPSPTRSPSRRSAKRRSSSLSPTSMTVRRWW